MANKDSFLTIKEKKTLEEELKNLKEVERAKVIKQLQIARSYGDLSENAEYDTARKKQGLIESRIAELETILRVTKVVKEERKKETVTVGSSVEVDVEGEGKKIYDIGSEGDKKGIEVSPHSPIAEGLLGKHTGATTDIALPKKTIRVTITKIL